VVVASLLEYCVAEGGNRSTGVDGGVGSGVNVGCWESGMVTAAGIVLTCSGAADQICCRIKPQRVC